MINSEKKCFLCGSVHALERHHCLHGSRRKKADEDGLTVYLCHRCHMRLHDLGEEDRTLQQVAERYWIRENNSDVAGFIKRYGKNYLEVTK